MHDLHADSRGDQKLAPVIPIIRTNAFAWLIGGALTANGVPVLALLGFVIACSAHLRARRTLSDRAITTGTAIAVGLWGIASLVAAMTLVVDHGALKLVPSLLIGGLTVFGMHRVRELVRAASPSVGVARWATIGLIGAMTLLGGWLVVFGRATVDPSLADPMRPNWLLSVPAGLAAVALVAGYLSCINHLMRVAQHPLAPREWPG